MAKQKIVTFLWFDDQAEAAVRFYRSLFPGSRETERTDGPDGKPLVIGFELAGQEFAALNGGPQFKFTEAVSLFVRCRDQAEADRYWDALTADGGEESQCGWLKDRWGLSWQIIPDRLMELLADPDEGRRRRATEAMLGMRRIDVAALERAADGA